MIYSVTAYTHKDIQPKRIRWKLSNLSREIPKEYRCIANQNERPSRTLKEDPVNTDKLNDPDLLKKCRQYRKYRNLFNKSSRSVFKTNPVECYFKNIDKAVEFVKKFDDERCYYRWIRISEIHLQDEPFLKYDKDDFEFIGMSQVPKSDRWFELEITKICNYVEGWGQTYKHTYTEKVAPIYLKGSFM